VASHHAAICDTGAQLHTTNLKFAKRNENVAKARLTDSLFVSRYASVIVDTNIQFEQQGTQLTAVQIGRSSRAPVVATLHRALFALGIVISSYHVRAGSSGLVERFVLQRSDGGAIEGPLKSATEAAILPFAR